MWGGGGRVRREWRVNGFPDISVIHVLVPTAGVVVAKGADQCGGRGRKWCKAGKGREGRGPFTPAFLPRGRPRGGLGRQTRGRCSQSRSVAGKGARRGTPSTLPKAVRGGGAQRRGSRLSGGSRAADAARPPVASTPRAGPRKGGRPPPLPRLGWCVDQRRSVGYTDWM